MCSYFKAIHVLCHYTTHLSANEILKNHKLALCDDQSGHMVPLPPVELPEIMHLQQSQD